MGLKELILNKGWAGRTLSRRETIERINPIIRSHCELNRLYDYALTNLNDPSTVREMSAHLATARADVGKLSETVLSAGGVSYNGTDLEGAGMEPAEDDARIVHRLIDHENEFERLVSEELELEHQIRTRAVLSVVLGNSRARAKSLRSISAHYRRPAAAE